MHESFCYPAELGDYISSTETFCMNAQSKGKAPDFILEAKNKGTKKWVIGTPTNEMWRRVCNNYNVFENIRENLMSSLGIRDPADKERSADRDVREEILGWRIKLRASKFLIPQPGRGFIGMNGAKLHPDLGRFDEIAAQNFETYVNSMIFRGSAPVIKNIDLGVTIDFDDDSDSEDL